MKAKFVVRKNDSGHFPYYEVWDEKCDYRYAEFYGECAYMFAVNHVRLLTLLKKESK
jgi:hypothetical protein